MHSVEYFEATEADIPAVIDARVRFLSDLFGEPNEEVKHAFRQEMEIYLKQAISSQKYMCWLAKMGNEIVGAGGLTVRQQPGNFKDPSGKVGYIMSMYTAPEHRRKGICTTILNKLMASANEMGICYFELHATKEGEPVYIKHNFKIHTEPTYRYSPA